MTKPARNKPSPVRAFLRDLRENTLGVLLIFSLGTFVGFSASIVHVVKMPRVTADQLDSARAYCADANSRVESIIGTRVSCKSGAYFCK